MTLAATISPRQIKAIHALVGQLGWDDDLYRTMLKERHGVSTCKALSHARAALLIDELKAKATPSPQPSPSEGRGGMTPARPVTVRRTHTWPDRRDAMNRAPTGTGTITPKQQVYIDRLFSKLGWDQRRRDGFCRRVIGRVWPQSNAEVTRLLNLLRAMSQRYPGGYDRERMGGSR